MEVIKDVNNEIIGLRKTVSISLDEYNYFKIYGADLDKPVGICKPTDIEDVKCKCGGDVEIIKIEQPNYKLLLELILECKKCKQNYIAIAERKIVIG